MKVHCCVGTAHLNYVDAAVCRLVAYLVLLLFCAHKYTETRVAATFMYLAYNKHSDAGSNCCLLLCSAHVMRVQQSIIYYYQHAVL